MTPRQTPPIDIKNIVMAVVLSMLIIFGWQYYYTIPAAKKAQEAQQTTQTQAQTPLPQSTASATPKDRGTIISASARLPIKTAQFEGSVNLTGARLDDLHLTQYRQTADPTSPPTTLLSPDGSPNAYFVEQGFLPQPGQTPALKLPDAMSLWQAPAGAVLSQETPVTLSWDNGQGLKFDRTISISDDYLFNVLQTVANSSPSSVTLIPYARVQRQDMPDVAGYWVFYEGLLGVQNGGMEEHKYAELKKSGKPVSVDTTGGWLGFTDKYWATMLIPDKGSKFTANYQYVPIAARDAWQADYTTTPITVSAGGSTTYQDKIFAGAKIVKSINAIYAKYGFDRFDLMIDWGWFAPLTKGMFYLLNFVHGLVGNFGLAILLVTVLVKLAVFPIASRAYASMSKMKKLKPQMDEIKAQFPDDRAKQQQETMALYKREKVSPLSGCLPMVIQIPVFFSLYKVILTTIELRHAPFFGWIHDLSAPDPTSLFNLFGLIPWSPPHALMIGFWPLLMGVTMWLQMRLNPAPTDPVQASMMNWMPVMFTFMLGTFPVGLVIYWSWSNILSVVQQSYIMKKNGTELDLFGNVKDSIPFLKKKPESA